MYFPFNRFILFCALFMAGLVPVRHARAAAQVTGGAPVFLTGTSTTDTNPYYSQQTFLNVYVGKTLVLPIVVSGSGPMSYSVSTSNANFKPILKTGYPVMTVNVSYTGSLGTLYSFASGSQGGNPYAGVIQASDGNLYGTTEASGTTALKGSVYQLTTSGSLATLYSFTGGADGGNPYAGLIQASDGNLYGTTSTGGTSGTGGTVFQITTSGSLTTLYSFTGGPDGGTPYSGLVQVSGSLYGTTAGGGTSNAGTVFAIATSGSLATLYSFTGGADGGSPYSGLITAGTTGLLYGTTRDGGSGHGTVYAITTSGSPTTLYSFTGGSDGGSPYAGLTAASDGNLYGTTGTGGADGFGTVFRITTGGSLNTLYAFTGGADGGNPYGRLVQGSDGALYGTTESSGTSVVAGTVFQITTSGTLTTLHDFSGGSGGGNPFGGLIQGSNGDFYGTTETSGTGGYGTVFELTAPFGGAMKFALLRDMAPATTAYIAGFAEAGYYNNTQFFRITNLSDTSQSTFIAQGGDPTNTGTGNPGFAFDNEFSPSLIFTGQGQLAMANAGEDQSTFRGTNGSQFFITQNPLRSLDFGYTIFGQLLEGFGVMQKVMSVPLQSDGSSPQAPVVMSSVTVSEDNTDAILLLSAAGPVPNGASITVNATDPAGHKATSVTAASGSATGLPLQIATLDDSINDPPFIDPVANVEAALRQKVSIPLKAQDLEYDYLVTGAEPLVDPEAATISLLGSVATIAPSASTPLGSITAGLYVYQPLASTERSSQYDLTAVTAGLGSGKLTAIPALFLSNPGDPLISSTSTTFAAGNQFGSFLCSNPTSRPGDFAITLNWGDGTVVSGSGSVSAVQSTSPAAYSISATGHSYRNAGIYPVNVTVSDTNGGVVQIQNTAVITGGPIYPFGRTFTAAKGLANGVVATFVDRTGGVVAADYQAIINWGDGAVGKGTIRGGNGSFSIYGTHQYTRGSTYPVDVTVNSVINSNNSGYAWSVAKLTGVPTAQPPFAQAHVNGQLSDAGAGPGFVDEQVTLFNSGNLPSGPISLKFYLYLSNSAPTAAQLSTSPYVPSGAIPLDVGKNSTYNTPSIPAGSSISGVVSDILLPSIVSPGKAAYIIMRVISSDPVGNHMYYPRSFSISE